MIQNTPSSRSPPVDDGRTSKAISTEFASDTVGHSTFPPVTGATSSTYVDLAISGSDTNYVDDGTQPTVLPTLSGITSNRVQGEGIRVEESSNVIVVKRRGAESTDETDNLDEEETRQQN